VGLTLLAGPANAGKVALLLERYLAALQSDPVLIVPNRPDVERAERELLREAGALVGGSIGTFDDLFRSVARGNGTHHPVVTDAQRKLLLRRVTARAAEPSARFGGFVDALGTTLSELESALLEPAELDGELAALYAAYRDELDRLCLWDRELERSHAAERVAGELEAWDGRPVFAYGFEDLTGAEWALLEALAGRSEVTVSLPYEPGREVFASLTRTADDLSALAGAVDELPPNPSARTPVLAHLERALFRDAPTPAAPELDGSLRFLEGAGLRGTLELLADEILTLLRAGAPAEQIAVVCPTLDRWRAALDTAFATLGVPYALEGRLRFGQTPFGHALVSLLRYAWLDGDRRALFSFLRSPYSGLTRSHADFLEGRLRGRAVNAPARVEEEVQKLRGQPLPHLEALRAAEDPVAALADLATAMLRAAHGLSAPPTSAQGLLDLRGHEQVRRLTAELDGWRELAGAPTREEVVALLEHETVRLGAAGEAGRVTVLDLLRARTRRFEVVFVLGLEEGRLPRRSQGSPFLDEERKAELERTSRGRLLRTDPVARDRYLFYTACTRPTRRLYLVREAATDDGSPREPSPFLDEVRGLFAPEEVERWTRRRPLSALTWPLESAPSARERLRALGSLASSEERTARALARANGWERRLERALAAFERPTRLTHPLVLEELRQKSSFSVTDLERFADCSSMWLFERVVSPRTIDAEADARLRGTVAHQALFSFFKGLPKRTGTERLQPETLGEALVFLRECLEEALQAYVRLDLPELERRELEEGLARDLEQLVRQEAESSSPLVPDRFEVSFGSERSAPELQRGLDLGGFTVSGKIDRIDRDPFGARGVVVDYKSGKTAHSARKIETELHLQIPLYMLVLRDLVGIEPLGGVYRALAGEGQARGLLREEARDDALPGYSRNDYVDEETFWRQIERAADHARGLVERVRAGDVRHDPKGGFPCPTWCDKWPMCRVRRS